MFVQLINKLFPINRSINRRLLHISSNNILLTHESNGVRVLTLNNLNKRNALSMEMLELLRTNLVDSRSLRCIVIEANGPVFCSGHDLRELERPSKSGSECHSHSQIFQLCSQVMCSMRTLCVPVICVVNGLAAAAGCQLVASADIAIASNSSSFSTPGANVGLFCSTPGIAVCRSTNLKTSAYMLFTGNSITAEQALSAGLLSRVVQQNQLEIEKQNIINSILSKSKAVLTLGKQFFYSQLNLSLTEAYDNGSRVMTENLRLYDCQHGIQSFISKTKPIWSHSNQFID